MKRIYILFALVLASIACTGQNIIPNASLETGECYTGPAEWLEQGSAPFDYYTKDCTPGYYGLPDDPVDGGAYVGLFTWQWGGGNYNYVAVRLAQPLEPGQEYTLALRASLAPASRYSTPSLGVVLATGSSRPLIDAGTVPAFRFTGAPASSSWAIMEHDFKAQAAAQWIVLGGFYPPTGQATQVNAGGHVMGTYMYVDELCLYPAGGECSPATWMEEPKQAQATLPVRTVPGGMYVDARGQVELYGVDGRMVAHALGPAEFGGLPPGVYLVRCAAGVGKFLIQ